MNTFLVWRWTNFSMMKSFYREMMAVSWITIFLTNFPYGKLESVFDASALHHDVVAHITSLEIYISRDSSIHL